MAGREVEVALSLYDGGEFTVAEIVAATGVSRSTIYRRLAERRKAAEGKGPVYGEGVAVPEPLGGKIVSARGSRRICASADWRYFHTRLADDRSLELKDVYAEYIGACEAAHEPAYSFNSFCSELNAWRRSVLKEKEPKWLPGECMLTYWALLEFGGERHWAFVAQLAFSDATFVCRSDGQSPSHWMRCCERAFSYFGGVPRITDCSVFGALMGGVSRRVRATLEGFASYHRTVLFGARPKTGKTADRAAKPLAPKNSSVVLRAVRRRLAAVDDMSVEQADRVIEEALGFYNKTCFSGQESRWGLLEQRELPKMLALPEHPYDMASWDVRLVANDYHFVLDGARYSCPHTLVGQTVRIRFTESEVVAYHGGELVARHAILGKDHKGKRVSTDDAHRPNGHRWFAKRVEVRFRDMAAECGEASVKVMGVVLARCKAEGEGFRACKELIDLRHVPSAVSLEEACAKVLASGEGPIDVGAVRVAMGVS